MKYKNIVLSIVLVGIFGIMIFSQIYEKNNNKLNINNNSSTNNTNETNYTKGNTTTVPLERPPFIDEIEETDK